MTVQVILSGGQTGADRGGLEAAIELGLKHGGWIPKGRRAEDGCVPERYNMREHDSPMYELRTEWNVRGADATVIFCYGRPRGGSALTVRLCVQHRVPYLVLDLEESDRDIITMLRIWLNGANPTWLNVAGTRESKHPGIEDRVKQLLVEALS